MGTNLSWIKHRMGAKHSNVNRRYSTENSYDDILELMREEEDRKVCVAVEVIHVPTLTKDLEDAMSKDSASSRSARRLRRYSTESSYSSIVDLLEEQESLPRQRQVEHSSVSMVSIKGKDYVI